MDEVSETVYTEDTLAFQKDVISALNECQTKEARRLCIFELASKGDEGDHKFIGGTYTESCPDLSFYYTISRGLFNCTILNIFACHYSEGIFIIGISASNNLCVVDSNGEENDFYVFLPNQLNYRTFHTKVPNESHHIKSFCFSKDDLDSISEKGLCISIDIDINPQYPLNLEVVQRLKASHDLSNILKERNHTLISASGKKYGTNKLSLLAHSHVLREIIKNTETDSIELDIDDDKMDLLQEYLHTGTIENASLKNYSLIFEVAEQFQLENLKLFQNEIIKEIRIDNAIDIFVVSEKFKLENLQSKIFTFVKENPAVLESESWKNLKDLTLTKKILKMM